jgi:hypothetical protein
MPAWLVAVLVAFVGLVAGLLGTYIRIAFERSADIRTRMLDAADEFVSAMTKAQDKALPAQAFVISVVGSAESVEDWADAQHHFEAAHAAFDAANARLPRIRLLFGVESASSTAAGRAVDTLAEVLARVGQLRTSHLAVRALDQPERLTEEMLAEFAALRDYVGTLRDQETVLRVTGEMGAKIEASRKSVDVFSRAARAAIVGEGRLLTRRGTRQPMARLVRGRRDDRRRVQHPS